RQAMDLIGKGGEAVQQPFNALRRQKRLIALHKETALHSPHLPDAAPDGFALRPSGIAQGEYAARPAQGGDALVADDGDGSRQPLPRQRPKRVGRQLRAGQGREQLVRAKAPAAPRGHDDTADLHRRASSASRSISKQSSLAHSSRKKGVPAFRTAASTRFSSN